MTRMFQVVVSGCAALTLAACDRPAYMSRGAASPAELVGPPANSGMEPLITTGVPAATITTSSVHDRYNASGILNAAEPGWHAARQPPYPQWVAIELEQARQFDRISLLPQDTYSVRGPKTVDVEVSADGSSWSKITTIENACEGPENRWRTFPLGRSVETRWLRLLIRSNCGDPELLTFRGLKLG